MKPIGKEKKKSKKKKEEEEIKPEFPNCYSFTKFKIKGVSKAQSLLFGIEESYFFFTLVSWQSCNLLLSL